MGMEVRTWETDQVGSRMQWGTNRMAGTRTCRAGGWGEAIKTGNRLQGTWAEGMGYRGRWGRTLEKGADGMGGRTLLGRRTGDGQALRSRWADRLG